VQLNADGIKVRKESLGTPTVSALSSDLADAESLYPVDAKPIQKRTLTEVRALYFLLVAARHRPSPLAQPRILIRTEDPLDESCRFGSREASLQPGQIIKMIAVLAEPANVTLTFLVFKGPFSQ
jgi:hypothetical protein